MNPVNIGGVCELTGEQAQSLYRVLTSRDVELNLMPVLQKLSDVYHKKGMSIIPKDMEAVYNLGVLRGKIEHAKFILSDLKEILSSSEKTN